MAYGYETEPLGETVTALGVNLARPVADLVHAYAQGLPIHGAHVIQLGNRRYRVYWVSGSVLVKLENHDPEHSDGGFTVGADVNICRLPDARVDLEATAFQGFQGEWNVGRTARLFVPGEPEGIVFPDPRYQFDNDDDHENFAKFFDALLRGVAAP